MKTSTDMDVKMNEALSKKLFDDFPRLYRNRGESSMQRGFECGDGWFDLVYKLSRDIEAVAHESGLKADSPEWPWCRGVKQKMGSLRFQIVAVECLLGVYERISYLRHAASIQSFNICEQCGAPGTLLMCDGQLCILCLGHVEKLCKSAAPVDWRSIW